MMKCEGCCVKLVQNIGTPQYSVRRTCTDNLGKTLVGPAADNNFAIGTYVVSVVSQDPVGEKTIVGEVAMPVLQNLKCTQLESSQQKRTFFQYFGTESSPKIY